MSTTDPKYPGWEVDEISSEHIYGRCGSVLVEAIHGGWSPGSPATIEIEHDTSWGCTTYVHVPPFVLAAMLRQLGWTVTEPGGGT